MSDEIDQLMSELKATKNLGNFLQPAPVKPTEQPIVTEENINDFILKTSSKVIQQGVDTIDSVRGAVVQGGAPEEIEALSQLISAVTGSIDVLNKINLQNKKAVSAKELKELDMNHRKQLQASKGPTHNTNILIAGREEVMKKLIDHIDKTSVIEVKSEDSTPEDVSPDHPATE